MVVVCPTGALYRTAGSGTGIAELWHRRSGRSTPATAQAPRSTGKGGGKSMNLNTNAQAAILDVSHLCVDYLSESGEVHAVSDVSMRLRRGEILGLAGESGSGKSTMAYAITRLL